MSKRLTLEQDIEIGRRYHYSSSREICKALGHGRTQVIRAIQPKYLSALLDMEIQSHRLTQFANQHLQREIKNMRNLIIAGFLLGISAGISLSLIVL